MADVSDCNIQFVSLPIALAIYSVIEISRGFPVYGDKRQMRGDLPFFSGLSFEQQSGSLADSFSTSGGN